MEVDGGVEAAQLAADQAGFLLLGEVLPHSNLYHFKEKRVSKRTAANAETSLAHIQTVKSFSHQTVNKVKRYKMSSEKIIILISIEEGKARLPG